MLDDRQLLRRYVADGSEAAFGELVARYVNLVYSAALRRTGGDAHLAQDVAQLVFTDLARKARSLRGDIVLAGWLHRATQYAAAQLLRTEDRRMAREQEAVAMNTLESETPRDWEQIRPLLDEAIDELGRNDRDALLLRFFEQRTHAEIGAALGSNEGAARKRVARALEKLRAHLARHGITTPAAVLSTVISVNAVQAAPAGLAVTLTSTALAGAAAGSGTALTLLKFMTMTKLKAGIISTIVIASVVTPLVIQHQAQAKLRAQDEGLRQRADKLAELQAENDRLSNLLVQTESRQPLQDDQFRDLLRLRGEVGRLRQDVRELTQLTTASSVSASNVLASAEKLWAERVSLLKQWLEINPSERIPELQFMTDSDWLNSIHPYTLETPDEYSLAMSSVRANAEHRIIERLHGALQRYARKNNDRLPTDLSQLTSYLDSPIDDNIMQRYEILPATNLIKELQGYGDWVITQKVPVNKELDVRFAIGLTRGGMADCRVTNRWILVH